MARDKPWGTVEIRFQPISASGPMAVLTRPEFTHVCFVVSLGVLAYYLYLSKVLHQLNPSKVVPNRVREALDTLAEGLLALDRNERIVLANRAFEESTGAQSDQLIGRPIYQLPLISRDDSPSPALPWTEAMQSGAAVTGRLFGMADKDETEHTFSVSASPIVDEKGSKRGALATFEDVTNLERKKRELHTMVDYLQASSDEIKRQNHELEQLATRDSLTGCLNRRAFFERFDVEWNSAHRYGHALSAMMVDIDHFKSVNDNHGYSVGDEVLRRVATAVLETSREPDIVCRYGGEEFAVLLPHTDIDGGVLAAERLRVALQDIEFGDLEITASLGVSSLSEKPTDPQDLLDQADKCLYFAKRNGRNQVARWDTLPADVELDEPVERQEEAEISAEPVSVPFHAVTALLSALAFRDQVTTSHSRRVADLCVGTAEGLLSLSDCYTLEIAALLHDIGKIGVPDSILLKAGPLAAEEWEIMRRHERIGVEIIRASFACPKLTSFVENYRAHYDGSDGDEADRPVGNKIPLGARILAIADAYDAMVSDRAYRKGRTRTSAFAELRRCAGAQFDAELVERFISSLQAGHPEYPSLNGVSKELALSIGLQIEGLSAALDNRDLDVLAALSQHLQATAEQHGADEIVVKARAIDTILKTDRDLMSTLQAANELLDICRATQQSFLEQNDTDKQMMHAEVNSA